MISKLTIQNFKSLKDISISTKPLNLLMGLNGMGKSSVIQSLLLLRQSNSLDQGTLHFNGNFVEIGKGKDAYYQYGIEQYIGIHLVLQDSKELGWKFSYEADRDYAHAKEKYTDEQLQSCSLFTSNFQYLHAERKGPQTVYDTSSSVVGRSRQIGMYGEFAVHFLNVFGNEKVALTLHHPKAKSEILLHQVDAWLGEVAPGVKLNTTEIPGTGKMILDYQFEAGTLHTNRFMPRNVGFGLSYVLPILVTLLSSSPDKLILIENPEAHIHPRGQAELGKLIALVAENGAQLFVETHSDHIVNGIRVAVKEKFIEKSRVGILYFRRVTAEHEKYYEQYSTFDAIDVDEQGELSDYPQDFMDEWNNQLIKLL